jgi:hypothetical protein
VIGNRGGAGARRRPSQRPGDARRNGGGPRRAPHTTLLLLALTTGAAAAVAAQRPALAVAAESAGARVQATALLADSQFVRLLRSGFPLRLRYRLELWRVRSSWFDDFVREVQWEAVARHDPLTNEFLLFRTGGAASRHAGTEELARAMELPYRVAMAPRGGGVFYYHCRLEVTPLSESDMDEVTRWLRGEVGPAVSGRADVGDALARGAQRTLLRLAGLPRLTLEQRSGRFRTGG